MIRIKEPKKRTPEGSVLQAVKQYLQLKGYYVIRIQQGLGCHRGLTDLIAIKDSKVLFIEVKTANSSRSKQSPYQAEFQREIEAHGGTYMLVRSVEELIYAQT